MADDLKVSGKIFAVLPTQTGSGKNGDWAKQDVILETEGQYPKKICLSFWGDKVSKSFKEGQSLVAHINIESREHNGKWYTDIKVWKYDGMVQEDKTADAQAPSSSAYTDTSTQPVADDDLPF